jgi:uncharacterized protein (DUF1697 family)
MARYAAFLRGVSPMNASMPELRAAFEAGGFAKVKTVIASGNVVFDARPAPLAALQRRAEKAMAAALPRSFLTIVRPVAALAALLEEDPYARMRLPRAAKRVVTFLREPADPGLRLPGEVDGARILLVRGTEVLSAYLPTPKGPAFMALIEKTFGGEVTTRTWETVRKVSVA